ncbi:MAG: hypothetical protein GTO54_12960 [Nitrososphaeria archaeon]|nr:hypothetical protein [Nitrososphaeria archaeon]
MLSEKSKTGLLILLLSFSLLIVGSAYFVYLRVVFPKLVPHHGGGERFTLSKANNYTYQIPWLAYSRLHLDLQANETVELYIDGSYVCDCSRYEYVIEGGGEALILLRSDSPVNGMFTARQEIPSEKWLSAFIILSAGLMGIAISIIIHRRNGVNF